MVSGPPALRRHSQRHHETTAILLLANSEFLERSTVIRSAALWRQHMSLLHERLQSSKHRVPLTGDLLKPALRQRQPARFELPDELAAAPMRPRQAGGRQRVEVLGHRLAGDVEPSASALIESGPSAQSLETRRRRVGSPSAANSGAASWSFAEALLARDIPLDVLQLLRPAVVVHAERLEAARGWNRSNPDSVTVSVVPPGASASVNSTASSAPMSSPC